MAEYKFPLTFACPGCGCEKTIARLVRPEHPGFVYMRMQAIPLKEPRLAVLTVEMLVRYWDQCAGCGQEYCTKVEIQKAPIKAVPKTPGQQFVS